MFYGMHSSHTSKYDYVYMLNREANLKHQPEKTVTLYRNCISLHIFKAVKLILFLKLAYKCIYFLDFYPATGMCRGQQIL